MLAQLMGHYRQVLESEGRTRRGAGRYVWSAERLIHWADPGVTVGDLDGALLAEYQASLAGCSPGFIGAEISALRHFCGFLRRYGLATDPTAELVTPRRPKRLPRPLGSVERAAVLEAIQWPAEELHPHERAAFARYRLAVLLVWYAGPRLAELAGLTWAGVDLGRRQLAIYGEAGAKGGKDRLIPLHSVLHAELELVPLERRWPRSHVLQLPDGSAPSYRGIEHIFDRWLAERAQVRPLGPHRVRATFATMCLEEGVNLKRLQTWMGHADLKTTEQYLALVDNGDAADIERLSA